MSEAATQPGALTERIRDIAQHPYRAKQGHTVGQAVPNVVPDRGTLNACLGALRNRCSGLDDNLQTFTRSIDALTGSAALAPGKNQPEGHTSILGEFQYLLGRLDCIGDQFEAQNERLAFALAGKVGAGVAS